MHTIRTFILRLFIDRDSPEILRGSVQAITQKEARPFASEQMLAALLRQMSTESGTEKNDAGQIKQEK
jgi:hypothetical protein